MRFSVSLKSLLRTPFKTILTFLLVAAASFALFSRVTDYAVTSREMKQAESFYCGVAALDNSVPNTIVEGETNAGLGFTTTIVNEDKPWPDDDYIKAFSSLPGVTLADTRYMTAGLVNDYNRLISASLGGKFTNFVLEGTYAGFDEINSGTNNLIFEDVILLAGDIEFDPDSPVFVEAAAEEDFVYWTNPYPQEFFEDLDEGSRCLVIGSYMFRVLSLSTHEDYFSVIDGLPENYLETDEFAFQRGYIEAIRHDLSAFDIVYTADMRSIPRFNERTSVITEGRPLNPEDTNACVVSEDFMSKFGHSIGDKVAVELGDQLFSQHAIVGAQSLSVSWGISNYIKSTELEIVGVFKDIDSEMDRMWTSEWAYSQSTVFVPASLLPVEVPGDHEIMRGEFSVIIGNARDIDAFLEAAEPLVAEMDIGLRFSDGGWLAMKESFETSSRTAFFTAVLYLSGAVLALLLAAYLYIGRNKKTYAIMRALGVTRKKSRNAIGLPLGALSILAIPAGGVAGLMYTSTTAAEALESMMITAPTGYVLDTSLPVGVIILCLFFELVFITLIAAFFMWRMGKTPPLVLLQGDVVVVNAGRVNTTPAAVEGATLTPASHQAFAQALPQKGRYSAFSHVAAYIFRHMRRVGWKTAISLALAAILTGSIGLLALINLMYKDAFDAAVVKGSVSGFTSASIILMQHSDLIEDLYYYGSYSTIVNGIDFHDAVKLTNNLSRYLDGAYRSAYSIEYADIFDDSLFAGSGALCIIGDAMAQLLGVGAGDQIALLSNNKYQVLRRYNEGSAEKLAADVERESVKYKVAGIVSSDNEKISYGVYAPTNSTAESVYGRDFKIERGEFLLTDNERLDSLNDFIQGRSVRSGKYASFYIDTAELDNIGRVRDLLTLLFPVAVIGAVLIGLSAPSLVIMQSAKEAALLRILGVTKKRARCILMFEQIVLCVAGTVLAAGGLILYSTGLFARSAETLAICGALYLLGCVCAAFGASISVTRRRVLVLLQVKE